MNDYKTIRSITDIDEYIGGADVVAFDFETSPTDEYRADDQAALDPHKADITGVSISVEKGTGRYIPLRHRTGENADIPSVSEEKLETINTAELAKLQKQAGKVLKDVA